MAWMRGPKVGTEEGTYGPLLRANFRPTFGTREEEGMITRREENGGEDRGWNRREKRRG